jgi:hypothetical protein
MQGEKKMKKYNFDFNVDFAKNSLRVSVNNVGITLNEQIVSLLKKPEKVNIGIDVNNKVFCIRRAVEDVNIKSYDCVKENNEDKKWIRINCRVLTRKIKEIANYSGDKKIVLPATYDEENNMIIVEIKQ